MSLIYARLQDLHPAERVFRMRHYLKVPFYFVRELNKRPTLNWSKVAMIARFEAEMKMNLLHDWADDYPKA